MYARPGRISPEARSLSHGPGLCVGEVAALKVRDIDSKRMLLRIEHGKGGRSRNAMLPEGLLVLLREWWRAGRQQGVLRADGLLFPGRDAMLPISTRQALLYKLLFKTASQTRLTIVVHSCVTSRRSARSAGGLCQAAVRRSRGCTHLSLALHPPGRHLEQSPPAARRAWGHVPLQGLSSLRTRPAAGHDAQPRRVHPPLPIGRLVEPPIMAPVCSTSDFAGVLPCQSSPAQEEIGSHR